jgi:hypothetical protein
MLDDWDFIKQNKPTTAKTGTLAMCLSMGQLTDQGWDSTFHNRWNTVSVTVKLDQDEIYSGVVAAPTHLIWQFNDSTEVQQHQLTVNVQGLDQLAEKNVMIAITELSIEYLPLDKIVEFTGTYVDSDQNTNIAGKYMGKDGQTTIPFSTPIYRWLFDNQKHFV